MVDRSSTPIIIDGDILEVSVGIIAHQVNCQGAIGAGVSGVICKQYPKVYERYKFAFERYVLESFRPTSCLLGLVVIPVSDTLKVANIFSQLHYGNSSKTGKVYTYMDKLIGGLKKIRKDYPDDVIYVPYKIGCGLAGGDWDEFMQKAKDIPNLIVIRKEK